MSEYQYYEFLAVDRPLDARQQAEVRALSTRARVTATSFTNEYHWGNFRGDPRRMMERFYDAHLYLTNWGTHQIMLRLPRTLLDRNVAEQYCAGDQVTMWVSGEHLILDLTSDDESGEWDEGAEDSLSAIVGVRAELAAGDLRPLYLAWLSAFGRWERDEDAFDYTAEDELEPPIPAGLGSLSAGQQALADFLRLDADLLEVAAEASPELTVVRDNQRELAAWIANLTEAEKSGLLLRVVRDQGAQVRMELLRRFRGEPKADSGDLPRRSVAELLDAAAERRQERELLAVARRAQEEARRARERALAREKRLETLAEDENGAWRRVDTMITAKKASEYDAAVELLKDLRAVAERADRLGDFTRRFASLRQEHLRKTSLIERFDRARLDDPLPG
ncbi:hypothetical protein OG884_27400 [Streptosporangium sp. NBC_01755]|uniref:hypothetical protein n=1 Tax=unclassified Streptosporangium TaxID=2632669 RepID=UPI002DD9CDA8|nr:MULTISPECIES: hypothetical protein [unclassified Streptosporangium]WSA23295.1 hypothetical protein OIE13_20205 [Streptosporangium sp. NBC_01810]WSC98567.1 hypothetical protein OG884_27400 [Streptosporangium sp. NBC_01755]